MTINCVDITINKDIKNEYKRKKQTVKNDVQISLDNLNIV
ncbi:hypothetical protein VIBC2010_08253 [Vibrio caribbeanicus ATCC BAA-2122]|uniref:Uncharacterized protein n=1 Tax=Vibrio caribbeanicus ATCC BAA-2122 TaxID=796620 RepID=E3BEA7_9VIBR|nr:hypothetical protein VIBC2010_08253 [Vibrio caribbeanicus ATCC BAA-2122]